MEIIKLRPPYPRPQPHRVRTWEFPLNGVLPAPPIAQRKLGRFETVLQARQSKRKFVRPLTLQQLSDLLWHSCRVRRKSLLAKDSVWESRPAPSGGGCHPIE